MNLYMKQIESPSIIQSHVIAIQVDGVNYDEIIAHYATPIIRQLPK